MYAEMLEEQRVSNLEKQKRYLKTITNESQRLTRLIDNVLDFSHLTQKKKHYKRTSFSVIDLIQTVLDTQEPRLKEAGMTLVWEAPETLPPLESDSDALKQVLLNLIDNAIKYASTGELLKVIVKNHTSAIEIEVLDKGPGIPAHNREKAFEAFQRLDESLTSDQPGSGIGLSICRSIIKDLGGTLKLTTSAGNGCSFSIQLPKTPTKV